MLQNLLLLLLLSTTTIFACTYKQVYTECVAGTRCLIEYDDQSPCTCAEPPGCSKDPVCGLPCENIVCSAGQFLNTTGFCADCEAGYYSSGGATIYDGNNFGSKFSSDFAAGCQVNRVQCTNSTQGWHVVTASDGNFYLDSGYFVNLNYVTASLFVSGNFVSQGSITFSYTVEAELYYDGITFAIDGSPIMSRVSSSPQITTKTYNVSKGYHIFTWVYTKDSTQTTLPDRAQIFAITMKGTSDFVEECSPCPAGTSTNSQTGYATCPLCDYDTYTPSTGYSSCLPCPSNQYAPRGSSTCFEKLPCVVENDMTEVYGSCTMVQGAAVRPTTWEYTQPQTCDPTNPLSEPLPTNGVVPCEPCNPGEARSGSSTECVPCQAGYYRTSESTSCQPCTSGTAAIRTTYYEYFYEDIVASKFTRSCTPTSECTLDAGWRAMNTFIDTGRGHGPVDMYLILNQEIFDAEFAQISFTFDTTCTSYYDCVLYFYVDNVEVSSVRRIFNSYNNTIVVSSLSVGMHQFKWVFHKVSSSSTQVDHYVSIDEIVIKGTNGGADKCVSCSAGYYSVGAVTACSACSPGHTSASNFASCVECPENSYAPVSASPMCYPCDQGTGTNTPAATECDYYGCSWTVPNQERPIRYDLGSLSLSDGDWGPIKDSYRSSFTYYLNLCNRYHNNSMCRNNKAGKSLETFICQITGTEAVNLGEVMGFYPIENVTNGLLIRFSLGASEGCAGINRETNLTLLCDITQTPGTISTMVEVAPCKYALSWTTMYACYLCSSADYEEITSECVDGTQDVSYRWIEPRLCYRGVTLPADKIQSCDVPKGDTKTAKPVAGIAIMTTIIVVVCAILGVLGYKYVQLKKQKAKLWQLGENGAPNEYKQFTDDQAPTAATGSVNK